MENREAAAALERMAGLPALKGENDFKVRAYSQAARQVIRLSDPLAVLINEAKLERILRHRQGPCRKNRRAGVHGQTPPRQGVTGV